MSIFENDFLMKQINDTTRLLGSIFLYKKEGDELEEETLQNEDARDLLKKCKQLIEAGNYKEASQYVKDNFKSGNMEYLSVALYCFDAINDKDDATLRSHGYSRSELSFDLGFISEQYGIKL